ESFVLFKDKCNAKNPGGGAFKPHQDVIAYDKFAPNYHVTAAIFLDAATLENGCLHFPRDYRQALAEFDFPQIKTPVGELAILPSCVGGSDHGNIDPEVERQIEWEPIVAAPGDVVLFDSYVPHYSHANLSNYKRRAMFFTFNPASQGEHYDAYYAMKHREFDNPAFHIATPTEHQLS
ncbi:MAG: phytanoyl-CoA dioxygenase family protein, partial [Pseudomonadales bacterium]